jgi:hypothetical protein
MPQGILKWLRHNKMDLKRGYHLLMMYNNGYIPRKQWLRLVFHRSNTTASSFFVDLAIIMKLINYVFADTDGDLLLKLVH